PEVELQIIDIGDNYYDEGSPHAITNTDADIFELDSVFMDDFVSSKRIQPLPTGLTPPSGTLVPPAASVVQTAGMTYAVPHWVCTNYLFTTTGDSLANVPSFTEVTRIVGTSHSAGQGLLVDMKGRSTLGE